MSAQLRLTVTAAVAVVLSASCLLPIFTSAGWVVVSLLSVAAVAAAGAAARAAALPRWLVPLAGAAALLVTLTAWFTPAEAWLVGVPTGASLAALRELAEQGFIRVDAYAVPVPAEPSLVLLAAAGLGLLALVVDMLAVTLRRPALTGFALAVLYAVPTAVDVDGVGWASFCAGGAGWLAILLVDHRERVSRWGRTVGGTRRSAYERSGALSALGRRVGVTGLAAAVVVPALVPGLTTGLLPGRWPGDGSGTGRGTTVDVSNPLIDLGRDLNRPTDREVLRYTTTDTTPGYLRLVVLDAFTGDTWAPTGLKVPDGQTVQSGFADPVGLDAGVASAAVVTEVEVLDLRTRWLPLPYPARRVTDISGRWLWDLSTFNVFSTDSSTQRQRYVAESLDVSPTAAQLRASDPTPDGFQRYLELPQDLPASISEAANDQTRGLGTPYERALALQEWFRDTSVFDYDEKAPDGNGFEALDSFLELRRGFCVHYASAMAVMARVLGIPARVAVGFTPGQRVEGRTWSVGTHDAHAWPELFFAGVGWVAFEPTPAERTGLAPVWARPAPTPTDGSPVPAPGATPEATPGALPGDSVRPDLDPGALAAAGGGGSAGTGGGVPWRGLALGLGIATALASPLLARVGLRRWRWRRARGPGALVAAAWEELNDLAVDHGLEVAVSTTPRGVASSLARQAQLPEVAASALTRLARRVERLLYAREIGEVGDPRAEVALVADALRRSAGRGERLRARLLPASVLLRTRRAGDAVALRGTVVRARLLRRPT